MIVNKIKTVLLLTCLSSILLLIGNICGGATGIQCALFIALLINGIAYFFSDKIVLSLYKAQPLDEQTYQWIYNIIEELSTSMHIPMPKLWIVHSPIANAFATGRNPSNASVAVTSGILSILDRDELRGVLAHELSHIKNRDILVSTIAATLAAAIGYVANTLSHIAFWNSMSNSHKERNVNPVGLIVVAIIMPIVATMMQLAVSRSREYLADETGAHYCHDPLALASALEKLHNHVPEAHFNTSDATKTSTAALFIVHPFNATSWTWLFSTHPPMHKRIERLHSLHRKMC